MNQFWENIIQKLRSCARQTFRKYRELVIPINYYRTEKNARKMSRNISDTSDMSFGRVPATRYCLVLYHNAKQFSVLSCEYIRTHLRETSVIIII